MQVKDSLIWQGTLNELLSVRSAYLSYGEEITAVQRSGSSRQGEENIIWKTIWNLKIRNASEIFMWRACNNLLPTKSNLLRVRLGL
jgi:hypothetical protein